MWTKWFSTGRYEFEVLIIGIVLFVGSWLLESRLNAPEYITVPLFLIGGIFILISGWHILFEFIGS